MRKRIWAAVLGVAILSCMSCIAIPVPISTPAAYDPDLAATHAVIFAKEAFIDLNQPGAYDFLSEEMRRSASLERFINMVARMHPKGFPLEVTAAEFESAPKNDAMFIWLYGKNAEENFYYRLRMERINETEYKVAEMLRMVKPPTSQSRKMLLAPRSTIGLR
jgi:hypothetical protein